MHERSALPACRCLLSCATLSLLTAAGWKPIVIVSTQRNVQDRMCNRLFYCRPLHHPRGLEAQRETGRSLFLSTTYTRSLLPSPLTSHNHHTPCRNQRNRYGRRACKYIYMAALTNIAAAAAAKSAGQMHCSLDYDSSLCDTMHGYHESTTF